MKSQNPNNVTDVRVDLTGKRIPVCHNCYKDLTRMEIERNQIAQGANSGRGTMCTYCYEQWRPKTASEILSGHRSGLKWVGLA